MKKNIMMRISAILLVAVLLTTCVISGTFAKYVSSNSGSEVAQVAKWGVAVTAPNDTLFSTTYNSDKVLSSATHELVAPNTNGELANFTISGTPEVAVVVSYSAELTLSNWKIGEDEYCPLIITVEGKDYHIGGTKFDGTTPITTVADLEAAVEEAISKVSENIAANTAIADTLDVSWRWEYSGEEVGATLAGYQTDELDSDLGDQAAAATPNPATVTLNVTCTVTQAE